MIHSTSGALNLLNSIAVAIAGPCPHRRGRADEPASFANMQRKVPKSVGACYDMIENNMFKGPWVMGNAYSIADPYLFTLAQWLEDDGADPIRIPHVVGHRARMAERSNVKKAIASEPGN